MDKKTSRTLHALAEGKDPAKWEGLGDVIASATKKLGFKAEECSPCEKRRIRLNKMFSFVK